MVPSFLLFLIVVGGGGCISVMVYFLRLWMIQRQEKRKETERRNEYYKRNGGLLLEEKLSASSWQCTKYSWEEIRKITNNFDDERIKGKGSYGTVYMGVFEDGKRVAVKKSNEKPENIDDFTKEIVILSGIKQRNIVQLMGYCFYDQGPIIVYEFVDNGTLHDHLQAKVADSPLLSWKERAEIATSVASALAYLHYGMDKQVVHRDIKPQNVLITYDRNAKLGDFGLCRTIPVDETHGITTHVGGTFGYQDPNMMSGMFRPENDVYSYGVLLIEILTKILPTTLSYSYRETFAQKPLSDILDRSISHEGLEQPLQKMAELAASCVQLHKPRPNMHEVAGKMDTILKEIKLIEKQQEDASSSSVTETEI